MNTTKYFLLIALTVLISGCALFGPLLLPEPVELNFKADDPSSGFVTVSCLIPQSENLPYRINLYLKDLTNDEQYFKDFTINIPETDFSVSDNIFSGNLEITILNKNRSDALEFSYSINALYYPHYGRLVPDEPSKAVSWLNGDMGILCLDYIAPVFKNIEAEVILDFSLPEGWTAVTPWEKTANSSSGNLSLLSRREYLVVGPMKLSETTVGGIRLTLGMHPEFSLEEESGQKKILSDVMLFFGAPPADIAGMAVSAIPNDIVHGGSAGFSTIVHNGKYVTLAHEFFHFWNNQRKFVPGASWFVEGVTEYYGLKLACASGFVSEKYMLAALADLEAEMKVIEAARYYSLQEAALNSRDRYCDRLIYAKGALFCWYLDCELKEREDSLDRFVRAILLSDKKTLTNQNIINSWRDCYEGFMIDFFRTHIFRSEALPELDLPEAEGNSGISYFFP